MSKQWYNDEKKRIVAILTTSCFTSDAEGNLTFISGRYDQFHPAFILRRVITGYTKRGCLYAHNYYRKFNCKEIAIAIFENESIGDLNDSIDINYSFCKNNDIPKYRDGANMFSYNDENSFDSEPFLMIFADHTLNEAFRKYFVEFYLELVKKYNIDDAKKEQEAVCEELQHKYLDKLPVKI